MPVLPFDATSAPPQSRAVSRRNLAPRSVEAPPVESFADLLALADKALPEQQRNVFRATYETNPPRNSFAVAQILRMSPSNVRYHLPLAEARVREARLIQKEGRVTADVTIVRNGKVVTEEDKTVKKALKISRKTKILARP